MKESSPPVSAMATPTNSSGNLVDEFEEAFQHCLNVLTKEEATPATDKDEIRVEVEQTTLRFIDLARQMEAFFLQKRFLLSALKPEMLIKEDINDLKIELGRKEELLKRHYDKINVWQNLLSDLQGYAKSPAPGAATPVLLPNQPQLQNALPAGLGGINPSVAGPSIGGLPPNPMQQQLQQQQLQQQLQQQQLQQQMQQQQMQQMQQQMQVPPGMSAGGVGPGMVSPQQALFLQQQQQQGLPGGPRVPFGQQGPGGVLQGPLAYLEKTTSNIDLVAGMSDGRR